MLDSSQPHHRDRNGTAEHILGPSTCPERPRTARQIDSWRSRHPGLGAGWRRLARVGPREYEQQDAPPVTDEHRCTPCPRGPCAARLRSRSRSRCCLPRPWAACAWPTTSNEAANASDECHSRSPCCDPQSTTSPPPSRPWWPRRTPRRAVAPTSIAAVQDLRSAAERPGEDAGHRGPDRGPALPGGRRARPEPGVARRQHRPAQPRHLGGAAQAAPVRRDPADHHDRERPARARAAAGAPRPDPRRSLLPGDAAGAGRHRAERRDRLLELFAELGVEGAAIDRLASELGASEPAVATLRTENAQRTRIVRTGGTDLGGAEAYAEYDQLIETLMDGIDDELAAAASDARERALVNAGITLGALLAAIMVALLISRLLLNPIRRVREGARAVAHERLPEAVAKIRAGEDPGRIVPIDVTTDEEVGQLARAVDDLHRQAVRLASGEAELRSQVSDMFVTLSRRNTSLINQQLGLIETLEKNEEDPARLESLFRLDHLAARMRRTADSLLVLADAPTRAGGHEDLTVADALQAAIAGVQDYQRVRVGIGQQRTHHRRCCGRRDPSPHRARRQRAGLLAADHHGLARLHHDARRVSTIEVADAGLGIPGETLRGLNETLRSGGDVTPDTARRMGLFVVSRLAQRYGITVSLQRNQDNGTTATVFLPELRAPRHAAGRRARAGRHARRYAPMESARRPRRRSRAAPDPIEATINASLGLPRREPGAVLRQPRPDGRGHSAAGARQPRARSARRRLGRAAAGQRERHRRRSTRSSQLAAIGLVDRRRTGTRSLAVLRGRGRLGAGRVRRVLADTCPGRPTPDCRCVIPAPGSSPAVSPSPSAGATSTPKPSGRAWPRTRPACRADAADAAAHPPHERPEAGPE